MESSRNGNVKPRLSTASDRNNSIRGGDLGISNATPGGPPTRSRPSSKMTKYVECWGADKPFANIAESTLAKNIELTVRRLIFFKHNFIFMLRFSQFPIFRLV